MTGCLPLRVKDLHDRYGPVVRVAPDELSYITALAWKEIYGFRTGHSQNPKHLGNHAALHEDQERHMLVANDEVHARHRRLLAHAFSAQAIEEQMPLIMSYVDLLVQRLKENAAQPQDMIKWFVWTSFDIIADLMFGEPFRGLQDQYYHPWVQGFCDGLEGAIYISAFNRYGLGFCLPYIIPKKLLDRYAQTWMYTKKSVASRLERGTDRPDFMSCILRNDKDGRQMSRGEIDANAELLILAGSETTSSLLTGATYYLCKYPDVLEKVTAEVRGAFDSDRKIVLNSVNQLEYLLAVLNEALRMYPPAPASLPRIILNGDVINGRWVPPGVRAIPPHSHQLQSV